MNDVPRTDWPDEVFILHPDAKTFGDMVLNPERKSYVRRDPAVLAALPEVQAMVPDHKDPRPSRGWNVMHVGQLGLHVVHSKEGWKVTPIFGPEILSQKGGGLASGPILSVATLEGGQGAAEAPTLYTEAEAQAMVAAALERAAYVSPPYLGLAKQRNSYETRQQLDAVSTQTAADCMAIYPGAKDEKEAMAFAVRGLKEQVYDLEAQRGKWPDAILACIPADAKAALDAVVADAVRAALEGAARYIVSQAEYLAEGQPNAEAGLSYMKELADEIRALIPSPAPDNKGETQ